MSWSTRQPFLVVRGDSVFATGTMNESKDEPARLRLVTRGTAVWRSPGDQS